LQQRSAVVKEGPRAYHRSQEVDLPEPGLTRIDLLPVLRSHTGTEAFREAFDRATDAARLVGVMARYVCFNAAFPGGLASLAGAIAAQAGLFRDPLEPVAALADRAVDVAQEHLFRPPGEAGGSEPPWRGSHRALAAATLRGMGAFFGFGEAALDHACRLNRATTEAQAQVRASYGLGRPLEGRSLFEAMGFHAGSETLAEREFDVLDRHLRRARPALVVALQATRLGGPEEDRDAYAWVRVHRAVHEDAVHRALRAANTALRFYAGSDPLEAVKAWMVDGVAQFAAVQGAFMAALEEP
jgi:hypothetical protein